MLTTSMVASPAIVSSAETRAETGRPPPGPSTLKALMLASGATPVMPSASSSAATRLATSVPWAKVTGSGEPVSGAQVGSQVQRPVTREPSSLMGATPVSITATVLPAPLRPAVCTGKAFTPAVSRYQQTLGSQALVWRIQSGSAKATPGLAARRPASAGTSAPPETRASWPRPPTGLPAFAGRACETFLTTVTPVAYPAAAPRGARDLPGVATATEPAATRATSSTAASRKRNGVRMVAHPQASRPGPPWAGCAGNLSGPIARTQGRPGEWCRFVNISRPLRPARPARPARSVRRDAPVDRPGVAVDAAAEVPGGGEARLPEQREGLGRAAAHLAVDDDRLGLGQLAEPAGQLPERDQLGPGQAVDPPLRRLAHVQQLDPPAVVEDRLQLGRGEGGAERRPLRLVRDHAAEVLVVDQLGDRRVLAADRAVRVLAHPDVLEGQLQRVVDDQPAHQRLADAGDQLDGLVGLDRADRGAEHAEHAALGAGGHHPRRGRFRVQAAVARAVLGPEDADLPVEAVDRAPDVGLALQHAGVVDQVAGGEVVRAVHHQVVAADQLAGVLRGQPGVVQGHAHERVDLGDLVARALEL